jgi:hypothetical protein
MEYYSQIKGTFWNLVEAKGRNGTLQGEGKEGRITASG